MLAYWFAEGRPEHEHVESRVRALPKGTPLFVSAITLGEIEYGHRVASRETLPVQERYVEFVREKLPHVLDVRPSTAAPYGELRALLFERYAPSGKRSGLRPEQLVDPISSVELGIQENDLWIAAQAIEYNLVLVTHDKMAHLAESTGGRLRLEDWAR